MKNISKKKGKIKIFNIKFCYIKLSSKLNLELELKKLKLYTNSSLKVVVRTSSSSLANFRRVQTQ